MGVGTDHFNFTPASGFLVWVDLGFESHPLQGLKVPQYTLQCGLQRSLDLKS